MSDRTRDIDGYLREPDAIRRLNGACHATFVGPAGKQVPEWLRAITLETVLDPGRSDAELRHQEGMRHIVKLIELRIETAERTPR